MTLKNFILGISAIFFQCLFLQVNAQDEVKTGWTITGENVLNLNQTAFSDWSGGGINSFGANIGLNYDFNYKKDRWDWDNKVIMSYGLSKTDETGWRKNDDQLSLNSLLGRKINTYWMGTFYLNFQSQFTKGYDYSFDPKRVLSDFFAPATIGFGPGFAYKKSDDFKMNFSPVASRLTFVLNDDLSDQGAYGVDPGDKVRYEFGAYFDLYYKKEIFKNISIENSLQLYSNYLENPQNVDIDYSLTVFMKVNDYVSANAGLQLIYDDDIKLPYEKNGEERYRSRLQVKQLFGVGLTYKF